MTDDHRTTRHGVTILPTGLSLAFHGHDTPGARVPWEADVADPDDDGLRRPRWHPSMGRRRGDGDDGPPVAG